jgi:hypothetical protein
MLAEAPNRFRGTVSKAGNELVTLAFHEHGYALRYKLDGLPMGYYHGPPDPCAVEAMLAVPLTAEDLVALVLGGAPLIAEPRELVDQSWDRRTGHETLTLANADFVQQLRFAWVDATWRFSGATLWVRAGTGDKGRMLWELVHDRHGLVGSAILPGRTRIRAPRTGKDNFVLIVYSGRDPDPPWARRTTGPAADDPTEGPGWDDDGGWEDGDDDGWEGEPAEEAETTAPAQKATGAPEGTKGRPTGREVAPGPPTIFVLDGAGLSDRGDLCRNGLPRP